jgi:UDP-N-acetylglucosamine 2-epimerase (non-hydrolysing)
MWSAALRYRIVCVVGTRPEGVKMAPVVMRLKQEPWAALTVLSTGQHREMLGDVLDFFGIAADEDLGLMQPNQALSDVMARALTGLDEAYRRLNPQLVIAQGDTTTVAAAALAAFHRRIPFAHVEAGLRTFDYQNPFPEEMNRVIAGRVASLHFAPTRRAADALRQEMVREEDIFVTGNTVIDALYAAVGRNPRPPFPLPGDKRIILVTLHRRESFGASITNVCAAVRELADRFEDVFVVWPVHLNPQVKVPVRAALADHPCIRLCDPLAYNHFIAVMARAHLILTDSGGVQEEAPALGKPVLVLRDVTERPEAVAEGVVALVGTDRRRIVDTTSRLLTDEAAFKAMARGVSPYGDGHATERIIEALKTRLGVRPLV